MNGIHLFRRKLRAAALPVVACCLFGYFAYHLVQGERGLIAQARLKAEIEQADAVLAELTAEREHLQHRAALLEPGRMDPDILDEQIRRMLNYAAPDEIVIPLDR